MMKLLAVLSLVPCLAGQNVPLWSPTAALGEARQQACATLLKDGRVLITGGTGSDGSLTSAEVYSKEAEFRPAAAMHRARSGHTCTSLSDGRVFVAGGDDLGSAEVYDPNDDKWLEVTGSGSPRTGHTATLLADGRVLLAGGASSSGPLASVEIFDSAENRLQPHTASLATARAQLATVVAVDGRVIFAGGRNGEGALRSTEIFDPVSGQITEGPSMATARAGHSATRLDDGRIFVAGGSDGNTELDTAEVLDAESKGFQLLEAKLTVARRDHLAILIPGNGSVLLAGGRQGDEALSATELFQPVEDVFFRLGDLTRPRFGLAGAVLESGAILAAGGGNADGPQAACGVILLPRITFMKDPYNPNETVVASGAFFRSSTTYELSLDLIDGFFVIAANNRRLTGSVQTPSRDFNLTAGWGPVNVVQVGSGDAGRLVRVTARHPDGTVTRATVPVKIVTRISMALPTASQYEGSAVDFRATLSRDVAPRSLTGTFSIQAFTLRTVCPPDREPVAQTNLVINTNLVSSTVSTLLSQAPPGQYCVFARYTGDGAHLGTSAFGTYTVASKTPTVTVTSSTAQPQAGSHVTLTARVDVAPGVPATPLNGGVNFTLDGFPLGPGQSGIVLPGSRTYTFPFTPLSTGPKAVSAQYVNDPFFFSGSAAPVTLNVQRGATTLSILNPPTSYVCQTGASVPFEAALTFPPALGLANRSLRAQLHFERITLGPSPIPGSFTPVAEGRATGVFSVGLAVSRPSGVQFVYEGDATLAPSSTSILPLTLVPTVPNVTIRQSANLVSGFTGLVDVTIDTRQCGVVPSGTIQILDGGQPVTSFTIPNQVVFLGATSHTYSIPLTRPAGPRTLTARYSGDSVYAGATAAPITYNFP